MRYAATILTLAAILFGGGRMARGEPDLKAQRPEKFLADWVRGSSRFEMYTSIHPWASDAHRADTEAFEVAVKALALRQADSARTRSALAADLVRLFHSSKAGGRARVRSLHVLGRLAAREGLGLLIEQSRSKQLEQRVAAIRALGFLGSGPAQETFLVYGGRLRIVVLPPAASVGATRALLAAVDAAQDERRAGKGLDARRAYRERVSALSIAIGDALRAHRSSDVTNKLLAIAAEPGSLRLDHDDVVEILARCAHHDGVGPLVQAVLKGSAATRALVARALGQSARKEAVEPLVALLGDVDSSVAEAARAALMQLAREKTAPTGSDRAFWEKRLGRKGERFDASRAEQPEDLKPGVYELGA